MQTGRRVKAVGKITLALLVGVLVGWTIATRVADDSWQSYVRFLNDAQQDSFTLKAEEQAEKAYFERSPEIAELELTRLLPHLDSPLRLPPPAINEIPFKQFVAHARLAKVQQPQGRQVEAEEHFQIALTQLCLVFPDSKLDSAADVQKMLDVVDKAALKARAISAK